MTWIKLEDEVADHPKIAGLSDRAFRWWIRSLCYCSRFLTDGAIPAVFLIAVKPNIRAELIAAKLWIEAESRVEIHDYLRYQTSRKDVEKERQRNKDRRSTTGTTTGTTAGTPSGRTAEKPPPEYREQKTEDRRQTTTPPASQRGTGLIVGGGEYVRLLETNAYVGAKLRVPKVLHAELMAKSGGDADSELRKWYAVLDEDLENTGKATGDVFAWLRPRHQAFAVSKGWIDAPPKAEKPKQEPFSIEKALANEAARKAGRAS